MSRSRPTSPQSSRWSNTVFLTEYGGHNDLSVIERTHEGFRVESRDPAGAPHFSRRVVAKRKDISAGRLAPVAIPPEPALPPPAAEQPMRSEVKR